MIVKKIEDFVAEIDEITCEQDDCIDQTLEEANDGQVEIEGLELVNNKTEDPMDLSDHNANSRATICSPKQQIICSLAFTRRYIHWSPSSWLHL